MSSSHCRLILWVCIIFAEALAINVGTSSDKIVDYFVYTPSNQRDGEVQQWEFFVVGRRVPWNEAYAICPIYGSQGNSFDTHVVLANNFNENNVHKDTSSTEENVAGSHLATLEEETRNWLARMLSESDYRYDGLWIGGQRKSASSNWTWIDTDKEKDTLISDALVKQNYPTWYKTDDNKEMEKNCLIFDRIGHDVPTFVPENCRVRKPFICMRPGKKKKPQKVVEGTSVSVDGRSYTLYQVIDDEEDEDLKLAGVRKLNGGGIRWKEAKFECQKRGQYLAMVFTNEAAEVIAAAMLKSRPSMESAWLGGWSADGKEWTWISSGFNLPSEKSIVTSFPPWLEGHPLPLSEDDDFRHQRGRCLILDRHLCPEHRTPVFLDLDCEKKRPFICQDSVPVHPAGFEPEDRIFSINGRVLMFSENTMTWHEGQEYCRQKSGRIASILDTVTLSVVLDKMTQLSMDHTWVGGHTSKTKDGWKWLDENNEILRENPIALNSSWCLEKEGGSFRADDETCLNLDREGHSLPLFYGLPCNSSDQYVLCSLSDNDKTVPTDNQGKKDVTKEDTFELSRVLTTRIRQTASYEQSGLLFVIDDSISVLNMWFAEELKLVAAVLSTLYPLSPQHLMGLITFSKRAKIVLDLTQDDPCLVLSFMSKELLANRTAFKNNDADGLETKTTDIINAASVSADIIQKLDLQKATIVFITDGEHVYEENNEKHLLDVVEKLNNLRNYGHDVIGIIVSQGQNFTTNYQVVEKLFSDSANRDRNLYSVKTYKELETVTSYLHTNAMETDYTAKCAETTWVVPKENELLDHLLQNK